MFVYNYFTSGQNLYKDFLAAESLETEFFSRLTQTTSFFFKFDIALSQISLNGLEKRSGFMLASYVNAPTNSGSIPTTVAT